MTNHADGRFDGHGPLFIQPAGSTTDRHAQSLTGPVATGATAGGYRKPISDQMTSTIAWAAEKGRVVGSHGATTRASQT